MLNQPDLESNAMAATANILSTSNQSRLATRQVSKRNSFIQGSSSLAAIEEQQRRKLQTRDGVSSSRRRRNITLSELAEEPKQVSKMMNLRMQ